MRLIINLLGHIFYLCDCGYENLYSYFDLSQCPGYFLLAILEV